jgi:hypothetical protein
LILTYFLQELRPYVSQLGTNPLAVELGTAGFLHEPLYNKLASVYNDSTHELLKSFVVNHDIYVTSDVQKETPATSDDTSFDLKHRHFVVKSPKDISIRILSWDR